MKRTHTFIPSMLLAASLALSCIVPAAADTEPFEPTPVTTGEQTTVHVSTAEEFLAALAPDTDIVLDAETIDLSEVEGQADGEYYYWEEVYDGKMLTVCNVTNLTIRAEGDDLTAHVLTARPRYAHVLNFENSSAITVRGFTAGHTVEPGYCSGGVLGFRDSERILIDRCGLYGCGVVGVWADFCRDIEVANSDIYECSWGGIYMTSCENVSFDCNTIRDLGTEFDGDFYPGTPYMLHETKNITIDGTQMREGYIGD